jgi:hypothetical protein
VTGGSLPSIGGEDATDKRGRDLSRRHGSPAGIRVGRDIDDSQGLVKLQFHVRQSRRVGGEVPDVLATELEGFDLRRGDADKEHRPCHRG